MSNFSGLIGFWNNKCSDDGSSPVVPARQINVNRSNTFRHSATFDREFHSLDRKKKSKIEDDEETKRINSDMTKSLTPAVFVTPPSRATKSELSLTASTSKQQKRISPFEKFKQLEKENKESIENSRSLPSSPKPARSSFINRHNSLPPSKRPSSTTTQSTLSAGNSTNIKRATSGAKEIILSWVQETLKDYPVQITNFSSCWADGLAFCALIHAFYPDVFDWRTLSTSNREYNFSLGFRAAEELADITPLLEVEDMVRYTKPDWKCVFTYVQCFYRRFRHLTPAVLNKVEKPITDDDVPCDPLKELEKEEEDEKSEHTKSISNENKREEGIFSLMKVQPDKMNTRE